MVTLTTSIQLCPGSSRQSNKEKRHQIGKEEVRLSLFLDKTILYAENLKEFP